MQFTNPAQSTTTVLSPGSTVGISGTVAVDASGHAIPIAGTVPTSVAAAQSGTPAAGPSFANRNVSSSSAASASLAPISGTTSSTTLVSAPGVASSLELHALTTNGVVLATSSQTATLTLRRSDNNAVIWQSQYVTGAATASNISDTFDFQGVTLPVNVGINFVLAVTTAFATSGTHVSCNLTYNVVT